MSKGHVGGERPPPRATGPAFTNPSPCRCCAALCQPSSRQCICTKHVRDRASSGPARVPLKGVPPNPGLTPLLAAQLVGRVASWASRRYKEVLGKRLSAYGLRYDDLYDPLQDAVRGRWLPPSSGHPECCPLPRRRATSSLHSGPQQRRRDHMRWPSPMPLLPCRTLRRRCAGCRTRWCWPATPASSVRWTFP